MADVCKVGFFRIYFLYNIESLVEVEVRNVMLALKCIDHQHAGAFQFFVGGVRDEIGIGNIAEVSEPESEHGQFKVKYRERCYVNIIYGKRFFSNGFEIEAGKSGIGIITENVGKVILDLAQGVGCAVHRHNHVLKEIIGADIIEAGCVVAVGMRENNGIDPADILAQHLLPEIRAGINYKILPADSETDGGS